MTNRIAIGFASAIFVLAIVFRIYVSGWGPPTEIPASAAAHFGLAAYPADNMSYVTWAQQANDGRWLFDILYTTTTHARVFFNPLFLAIGKIAGLFDTTPILVLNAMALFSLPIVVLCVWSMSRDVGLNSTAALTATCLAIGGGGISWARKILEITGFDRLVPVGNAGPDLYFYDVYPVIAYFIAPYHAVSLAFLAGLSAMVVRFDNSERRLTPAAITGLLLLGVLVAAVRPHTAIMVLAAYAATMALSWTSGLARPQLRRRTAIGACLAGSMLVPVLFSVWVAQQPVWSDYARMHRPESNDWLIGFFLLWIIGAGGAVAIGARRLITTPLAFPGAWAFGAAILLMVLNGFIFPKLTYGFTMGLGLFAGVAIEQLRTRFSSKVVTVLAGGLMCVAFASPLLMLRTVVLNRGVTAPSELFAVVQTVRGQASSPFPSVLTDCNTGVVLPGLGGTRVFCGHWALTDGNRPKIVLLSRIGFLPAGAPLPAPPNVTDTDVEFRAAQLLDQLKHDTFQFIVIKKTDRLYGVLNGESHCALMDGAQFAVWKMCPEIKTLLESAVVAEMSEHTPVQSKS